MTRSFAWIGQGLLYGLFALVIGVFSGWPRYQHLPPDQALIKLSFIHHGQRLEACRRLTEAELAKLPANMRNPLKCPRERSPVEVEVDLDGTPAYRRVAAPSGLSGDGASSVYHRMQTSSGAHRIVVRLKDKAGGAGFDYTRDEIVTLKPAQVLVIDFDADRGGITLQ